MTPNEYKALIAKQSVEKKKRKHEESDFQKALIKWLWWAFPRDPVTKLPSNPDGLFFYAVPNGGSFDYEQYVTKYGKRGRFSRQGNLMRDLGVLPGANDIEMHWFEGKAAIEIKSSIGKLSSEQELFQTMWQNTGGVVATWKTWGDVKNNITAWQLRPMADYPMHNENIGKQMRQNAMLDAFRPLEDVLPRINRKDLCLI